MLPRHHPYPNPGYLGSSSHTALFGHLPVAPKEARQDSSPGSQAHPLASRRAMVNEAHITHGAELIDQLCRFAQVPACLSIAKAWLRTGANLVLGGMFTEVCLQAMESLLAGDGTEGARDANDISRSLFAYSSRPLVVTSDTTLDEFRAQLGQDNTRWESICFFLITVSRATMGVRHHESPFESESKKRHIRRLAMHYADRCLDICLSLDCLNDLQFVLQYENFILHTLVDGDQSVSKPFCDRISRV